MISYKEVKIDDMSYKYCYVYSTNLAIDNRTIHCRMGLLTFWN